MLFLARATSGSGTVTPVALAWAPVGLTALAWGNGAQITLTLATLARATLTSKMTLWDEGLFYFMNIRITTCTRNDKVNIIPSLSCNRCIHRVDENAGCVFVALRPLGG